MDPEGPMKYVEWFSYKPTLDYQFDKPKSSGRKPSDTKLIRKPDLKVRLTGKTKRER